MSTPLRNRQARQDLQKFCRTDSELEQLILDHFGKDRHLIPKGVDRLSIENRLIEVVGARAILRALEGPRYYMTLLLQGAGVLGLVVGTVFVVKQLQSAPIGPYAVDLRPVPGPDAIPFEIPKGPPLQDAGTAPITPPIPSKALPSGAVAVAPVGRSSASQGKPGGRVARSTCPAQGVLLERSTEAANFQTAHPLAANGYARGGKLQLVGIGGPTQGQMLSLATVVEADGARLEVHAERKVVDSKVCAAPLGEALHAGKELGKLIEDNRINLGSGDGVKVSALYDVLGAVVSDEDSTGRSLGRKKIGTVRVTAVDSVFSEVERVEGTVAKGSFVRARRSEGDQP